MISAQNPRNAFALPEIVFAVAICSSEKHMMGTLGSQVTTLFPAHVEGARRGIHLSFILLEPVVYLQRNSTPSSSCEHNPAVLRGSLHLKITEPTKIRSIRVFFHGLAQFRLWGESPHEQDLIRSGITYFDHGCKSFSDILSGQDCCHLSEKCRMATESCHHLKRSVQALRDDQIPPPEYYADNLDQSGLLDSGSERLPEANNGHLKGHYGLFSPGDYTYPFEFLVHHFLPESINTGLISTRYYLEAIIESPRLFRSKMRSELDVPFLRLPSETSLELIEPILFTNDWLEQLHYDACILGRSFRLGTRMPIRLKLTPLANLECHWVKVHISQHVRYWRTDRQPHRLQLPTKRVLLLQKEAGIANYSTYPGSRMRITLGKGTGRPAGMQRPKLLGQILETSEIELEVQLPRCPEIEVKQQWQRLQPSTKGGKLEVNHWIQITLCLSNEDEHETATSNPRVSRFLIIESPITILSCKATPANIYVPPYTVEPDITAMPLHNCLCDYVGSASPKTPATVREAKVPDTEESTTSVKSILLGDITRPLNFDSSSTELQPPAQIHLPGWDLSSGLLPRMPKNDRVRQPVNESPA